MRATEHRLLVETVHTWPPPEPVSPKPSRNSATSSHTSSPIRSMLAEAKNSWLHFAPLYHTVHSLLSTKNVSAHPLRTLVVQHNPIIISATSIVGQQQHQLQQHQLQQQKLQHQLRHQLQHCLPSLDKSSSGSQTLWPLTQATGRPAV